jgi:hypothetical protein
MSYRELLNDYNVVTAVSLCVLKVTRYIKKHRLIAAKCTYHNYNMLRKQDLHLQSYSGRAW